jgi:hypothetical protein
MGNTEAIAVDHYLQETGRHLADACNITTVNLGAHTGAEPSLIAPHAPSAKTQTLQNKGFPVIDHHGPSAAICAWAQVGDEGLERFSHEPIKHEFLDQPSKQVVANAVANPTLSETVALLIDRWYNLGPEERAVVTTLLWPNSSKARNDP